MNETRLREGVEHVKNAKQHQSETLRQKGGERRRQHEPLDGSK